MFWNSERRELMHSQTSCFGISVVVAVMLGCAPAAMDAPDGGGMNPDASDGGGTVTYTANVQPILQARCTPCHSTGNNGDHNIAADYADVHQHVEHLTFDACWDDFANMAGPKTVGECSYILARDGAMPLGLGCFNQPQPAGCVTQPELAIMQAWVAAGMPQ
jgi:hypothetical protein